jgi:integrase
MKVRPEYDKEGNVFRWCVDAGKAAGKRIRKRFSSKAEAELWAKENKTIKRTEGIKTLGLWAKLSEAERGSLIRALEILRPVCSPINFEDVARTYVTFAKPSGGKKLLTEAVQELLERKIRANKKKSYIDRLDRDLNDFARDFPGLMVSDVSQRMIEDWAFDDSWKPITQRNRLRDLHQLFAFALKEKWCGVNPVADIEKPSITWESPEVFTPQEAEWIMRTAEAHPEWEITAFTAIGLFAGLRTCELFNLNFEDIKLDRKMIILGGSQTKTRARRIVDKLPDNLIAWLKPYGTVTGPICKPETTMEWRLPLLVKEIQKEHPKFIWKRNGMRHSSASYHLAKNRNENITALVHGHRPEILFRYYLHFIKFEGPSMANAAKTLTRRPSTN